jgi:uncharacterized damage-inducible protein DinB
MSTAIVAVFEKDLNILRSQIESYSQEDDLWKTTGGIKNSAGNLCLHILGNLNHYIGAILGQTGYIRDRPLEFTNRVKKQELIDEIDSVKSRISEVINNLPSSRFEEAYPEEVLGYTMTTQYFLIHLLGHLNYHLGQINYHRRILC